MSDLPGGWTLDDLTALARIAARIGYGRLLDPEEATDVAAVAIVERLYADPPPSRGDLINAGCSALSNEHQRRVSFLGLTHNVARQGREGVPQGYARYWDGRRALVAPFEDDVVERLAVQQVMAALRPIDRETLTTLAEHGSYEGAWTALGITHKGWEKRIAKARRNARALWFHPDEPPAGLWGGRDRPGLAPDSKGRNRGLLHLARKRWASTKKETAS